jgi:F420-dependent oxidoreductase-like protein
MGARTERLQLGAGILQIPARTPAMAAMTAATLDELSGGRFRLGLGVSGPQVVEGWHGVPYGRPLGRTREYVEIVRSVLRREGKVIHQGEHYQIPYAGSDASGLGIPLKLIGSPHPNIPIYLAAIGPKNVELCAEIADGWLAVFFSPDRAGEMFGPSLEAGFDRSGEPEKRSRFDVVPTVQVAMDEDLASARAQVKPLIALYIGGMGAQGRNYYNELAVRYGYEEAASRIQRLYLEGRKEEAIAAGPDALVDEVCLVGPPARIKERLAAWQDAGVTTLAVGSSDLHVLRVMAELAG